MNKLTLEEIARLAGVSRSTVSRVVNNHSSVRPHVRQRVLQIISETGYQPDRAARALAGQPARIIGLVVPRVIQFLFTDPYYPRLMQGISRACNESNYIMSLFLFHTVDDEEQLSTRVLRNQLVDGVIVSALPVEHPLLAQLQAHGMPFVMIGRPAVDAAISYVDVDNVTGAYQAVNHLAQLGHRRIATITGPLNTAVGQDRRQGYVNALQTNGLPLDEQLVVEGDFTEAGGYLAMERLLAHRPTAVFVASDTMAMGALWALRRANVAVPDQMAVVGFDDLPASALADPPLTTVRQPIGRLGARATEILIDILEHSPEPPRQIVTGTELVIRASCGAAAGRN